MKLSNPQAFLAYRHDDSRCCHNAVLHGGHHRGAAWLDYDSGGSLSSSFGGSSGSGGTLGCSGGLVTRRLKRLGGSAARAAMQIHRQMGIIGA